MSESLCAGGKTAEEVRRSRSTAGRDAGACELVPDTWDDPSESDELNLIKKNPNTHQSVIAIGAEGERRERASQGAPRGRGGAHGGPRGGETIQGPGGTAFGWVEQKKAGLEGGARKIQAVVRGFLNRRKGAARLFQVTRSDIREFVSSHGQGLEWGDTMGLNDGGVVRFDGACTGCGIRGPAGRECTCGAQYHPDDDRFHYQGGEWRNGPNLGE